MKFYHSTIIFFIVLLSYGQKDSLNVDKKFIKSGIITLKNGNEKTFINLYYKANMVTYTNIETLNKENLLFNFIKGIEEKELDNIDEINEKEHDNKLTTKKSKDNLFKPNYPEGVYFTKQDFINKKPNDTLKVVPKSVMGKRKNILQLISHNCMFYYSHNDKKVKKVFAISYKGHLYFQLLAILKNRNKTDRAQTTNFPNSFVRVMDGGNNYFYTEVDLANQWAQGFLYNVASGVFADDVIYGKGVVWDIKKEEFNIFKNCKDYNIFISEIYPEGVQKCEKQQPDILDIRQTISKIK
jgi:hypothetical protein